MDDLVPDISPDSVLELWEDDLSTPVPPVVEIERLPLISLKRMKDTSQQDQVFIA